MKSLLVLIFLSFLVAGEVWGNATKAVVSSTCKCEVYLSLLRIVPQVGTEYFVFTEAELL